MPTGPLRLVVAAVILLLLGRVAVGAWHNRDLTRSVWAGIGLRHVAGAIALVAAVVTTGVVLLSIPPLRIGLGSFLELTGNAVFAPLQEAAVRAGPAPAGPDWTLAGMATAFLLFLLLLLPWLAFVEEEVFRGGLEAADVPGEIVSALRFGLVHLVMLVPVGATLAIAVAGFAYGRVYRRTHERAGRDLLPMVPDVVARAYRPSRRGREALKESRRDLFVEPVAVSAPLATAPTGAPAAGPAPVPPTLGPDPTRRQAAAVYASTVWHTTFNSLLVVLLWVAIVYDALVVA